MNQMVEQVVVGSLLGDGHISEYGQFQEKHCEKQHDYLSWKERVFKTKFDTKLKKRQIHGNTISDLYMKTSPLLQKYREIFYPNGKKIITRGIGKRLGKLAIVVWYFDDGYYNPMTHQIGLASLCFSYKENRILQQALKNNFSLHFNICHRFRNRKHQYYLFCSGENTNRFLHFIKENARYIPKSLIYKMGTLDKHNKKLIIDKRQQKREKDKLYYENNKRRIKSQTMKYYLKNRERCLKDKKEYYQKNKERCFEQTNKWRKNNPDKVREMGERWRKKNPNYFKLYYQKNKNLRGGDI